RQNCSLCWQAGIAILGGNRHKNLPIGPGAFEIAQIPVLKVEPMAITREKLASCDPVWAQLRAEAETMALGEPALAGFIHATILKHDRLENALSYHLARKLGGGDIDPLL